jgi:3',5'-cyclic-AMP phosphodiesterase
MAIVLQLSDPHLLHDPRARLRGVPTRQTFCDVLQLARSRLPAIDRLVLTGDLAHDEEPETYLALQDLLGHDGPGALALPGNHDDRAGLRAAFPRLPGDGDASVRFIDHLDGWCLVGLDSQITGQNTGRIGAAQLCWLRDTLSTHASGPTVVFVHHAPIATGHPKMDSMGLLDADALSEVLAGASGVRAVFNGHIHRALEGMLGSIPVYGAPSTAFQFPGQPNDDGFDLLPPGCRVIHLEPEGLRTEVLRLPRLEYVPQRDEG